MGLIRKQANLGLKSKIDDWLKKWISPNCFYIIGDDMLINSSHIVLCGFEGESLPDYIQFGNVGHFYVGYCPNLRSCNGFPLNAVKLEIGWCGELRNLNFHPDIKCNHLILSNLEIESLSQLPETIKRLEIWCCDNLQSFKGCPQNLNTLLVRHNINLTLEDFPTNLIEHVIMGNNLLISNKYTKEEVSEIIKTSRLNYY